MRKIYSIICFLMFILAGCQSEPLENSDVSSKELINQSQDVKAILYRYLSPLIQSRSEELPEIISIKTQYYAFDEEGNIKKISSSEAESAPNLSFPLITAITKHDDAQGYAILSTDSRVAKVFFYTKTGEISDTSFIYPLKVCLDKVPFIAANAILGKIKKGDQSESRSQYRNLIDNIVSSQWGQGYPFNLYMPICPNTPACCCPDGKNPTGSLTTAIAQYIAKCAHFSAAYATNMYLNSPAAFQNLVSPTSITLPPAGGIPLYHQNLGHFFKEIGDMCNVSYGCELSTGLMSDARQYLTNQGYVVNMESGAIDFGRVYRELYQGRPHIISGKNANGLEHTWLITGCREDHLTPTDGGELYYFYDYYCNWGYGGTSNGWVVGNPYTIGNPNPDVFDHELTHIYTSSIL